MYLNATCKAYQLCCSSKLSQKVSHTMIGFLRSSSLTCDQGHWTEGVERYCPFLQRYLPGPKHTCQQEVTKSSELQRVQSNKEFRVTKSSEDSKSLQVTPKVKTLKASLLEVGHGIAKALYLHCTNLNKSSTFLTMGRCRQRNFIPLPLSPRLLDDNYNVFISYWGKDLWRN